MSFSDPLSVTISAVAISLPRTSVIGNETLYTSADSLVQVSVAHDEAKRNRRVLRINHSKITADPFIPDENRRVSMSNYLVFDLPPEGYTVAEAAAVYAGFKGMFTASSDALITKLLAGES